MWSSRTPCRALITLPANTTRCSAGCRGSEITVPLLVPLRTPKGRTSFAQVARSGATTSADDWLLEPKCPSSNSRRYSAGSMDSVSDAAQSAFATNSFSLPKYRVGSMPARRRAGSLVARVGPLPPDHNLARPPKKPVSHRRFATATCRGERLPYSRPAWLITVVRALAELGQANRSSCLRRHRITPAPHGSYCSPSLPWTTLRS